MRDLPAVVTGDLERRVGDELDPVLDEPEGQPEPVYILVVTDERRSPAAGVVVVVALVRDVVGPVSDAALDSSDEHIGQELVSWGGGHFLPL